MFEITAVVSPPVFAVDAVSRMVAENATSGDVGTAITAPDPDSGQALTYSVTATTDLRGAVHLAAFERDFVLDAATGQVEVRAAAVIDYETRVSYKVSYLVSDGRDSRGVADGVVDDTLTLTVAVTNVNEPGVVAFDGAALVGGQVTASLSDPDGAVSSVVWEWSRSATADGAYSALSPAVATAVYTPVAADEGMFLRATATYTDDTHTASAQTAAGTAAVLSSPVFAVGAVSRTVAENAASGAAVGAAVTAADADGDTLAYSVVATGDVAGPAHLAAFERDFVLDAATGQVEVRATAVIDYETRVSYKVTYQVSDGKDSQGGASSAADDTLTLTVAVTNVNEPGVVAFDGAALVGGQVTASLSDPDGAVSSVVWEWSRSATADGAYSALSPAVATAVYTPVAADEGMFLRAMATYTDDTHTASAQTAAWTAAVGLSSSVFAVGAVSRTVAENAASGAAVGAAVTAVDADGDTLAYSVVATGDVAGPAHLAAFERDFVLDAATGQVEVRATAVIDYETRVSYKVTYQVSDGKDSQGGASSAVDDTLTLTVEVTNVNEPGVVLGAITDLVAEVGRSVSVQLPAAAGNQTYSLCAVDGAVCPSLPQGLVSSSATRTISGQLSGPFDAKTFRYTATDPYGGTITQVFEITAVVSSPVFAVDAVSRTIAENTTSGDVGTAITATDPDSGDVLVYSVAAATSETDSAAHLADFERDFLLNTATGQVSVKAAAVIDFETRDTYKVEIQVSDNKNGAGDADPGVDDTVTLTISVSDVSEAPRFADSNSDGTADAVSRMVAENTASGDLGAPVTASDPDSGDVLVYSVAAATSETDSAAHLADFERDFLLNTATGQVSVRAAAVIDFEARDSYKVEIQVSDNKDAAGGADPAVDDTLTLTIGVTNANEAGSVSVSDNPQAGRSLTASVSDPDGAVSAVSWVWSVGASPTGPFSAISGATDASFVVRAADLDKYLQATATYTDSTHSASGQTAAKTVGPVDATNFPPGFADSNSDGTADALSRMVAENTTSGDVGTAITATDPDSGDVLVYSVAAATSETDSADHLADFERDFLLNTATGQVSVRAAAVIDFEARTSYRVEIRVSDNKDAADDADPGVDDTVTLTISVSDVSEAPRFADSNSDGTADAVSRTIAENTTSGDVGTAITATDPDSGDVLVYSVAAATSETDSAAHLADFNRDFLLNTATGQVSVKAAAVIDFETRDTYKVEIQVSDNKDAAGDADPAVDDTLTLTIGVTNANEAGSVSVSDNPQAGRSLTASVSDPDGAVSAVSWVWSVGASPTGPFSAISGATDASFVVRAADLDKYLQATATYTDSTHSASGQTAAKTVGPVDATNFPPGFADSNNDGTADAVSRMVAENTASGDVGAPVTASDPDSGDTLVYSVAAATSETDSADHLADFNRDFLLNTATGQVSVRAAAVIDFEARSSYRVEIRVSDNKDAADDADPGVDDTVTLTIGVTNANEAGSVSVSDNPRAGWSLTASVSDPDGAVSAVSWVWSVGASPTGPFSAILGATDAWFGGTEAWFVVRAADLDKYLQATATYTDSTHSASGQTAAKTVGPVGASGVVVAPSVPREVRVVSGLGAVTVSWYPSQSNGGAQLSYEYRSAKGSTVGGGVSWLDAGDAFEVVVDGLETGAVSGELYTVELQARNEAGYSDAVTVRGRPLSRQYWRWVSFGQYQHSVEEGGAVATVRVRLQIRMSDRVEVPVVVSYHGGATSDDVYEVVRSVVFEPGERERTLRVRAVDDRVDDDGEWVGLGFGDLPAGLHANGPNGSARVSIVDSVDDVPGISAGFVDASMSALEGQRVTPTLMLTAAPEVPVVQTRPTPTVASWLVRLELSWRSSLGHGPGRFGGQASSWVRFDAGHMSRSIDVLCPDDQVRGAAHSITVEIDSAWLEGVPEHLAAPIPLELTSGNRRFVINCTEDDTADPPDTAGYPTVTAAISTTDAQPAVVHEAGETSATLAVTLSADPGRDVWIPLRVTADGADSSDFDFGTSLENGVLRYAPFRPSDGVHRFGDDHIFPYVLFRAGGPLTQTFRVWAQDDRHHDPDEAIEIALGNLPARITGTGSVRVSISDDDPAPAVTLSLRTYDSPSSEDAGPARVCVRLDKNPQRRLVIALDVTRQGGATPADHSAVPAEVVFEDYQDDPYPHSPRCANIELWALEDTERDPNESITITITTTPPGVTIDPTRRSITIELRDND